MTAKPKTFRLICLIVAAIGMLIMAVSRPCDPGWYLNYYGTCTQNGFHTIDGFYSCADGTHAERSECVKDDGMGK
jgi:hypothetical protein